MRVHSLKKNRSKFEAGTKTREIGRLCSFPGSHVQLSLSVFVGVSWRITISVVKIEYATAVLGTIELGWNTWAWFFTISICEEWQSILFDPFCN